MSCQYHPIAAVFRELKAATYAEADVGQLATMKATAASTRSLLAPVFHRVSELYGQSPLATVEGKVAAVKEVMSASVARALQSVEQLEDMEESSERFEEQSKQFHKKTVAVKKHHRRNYWLLGAVFAVVVLAVIIYFSVPSITSASHSTPPSSSSCTGSAS